MFFGSCALSLAICVDEILRPAVCYRLTMKPALAQSAKSSREPSPASIAIKLIRLAPSGISTLKRHAEDNIRMTGLVAADWPSMKTLKTTLGYFARFEPLLMLTRFSSAPASATKLLY